MIQANHEISITVNGEQVDIYSVESLNLRINNVVFSPVSVSSKTGEYSFSFELPATARNNRIFGYANNSAKTGKFNTRYDCEVTVDGIPIFKGILRLTDTMRKNYKCNLVNIKAYNIEEIFGDMKMSDLDWQVDFNGTDTINTVNRSINTQYYFPLVCYGAFQKDPKATYNGEINEYTDLLQIDYYNKWYWESFHPSLSLLETVRRLFEQRGYEVSGDVFNDPAMKRMYLSEYIDSAQDPYYPLNKSEIGDLHVAGRYSNMGATGAGTMPDDVPEILQPFLSGRKWPRTVVGSYQDLTFPREPVTAETYDWDRICWFDVLGTNADGERHTFTTEPTNPYIYRRNNPASTGGFIYIPSDGLYTIELSISGLTIEDEQSSGITYEKKVREYKDGEWQVVDKETELVRNYTYMPVEIHLLRNSNETELIGTVDENYIMYPHEMDYSKYSQIQRTTGSTTSSSSSSSSSRSTLYRDVMNTVRRSDSVTDASPYISSSSTDTSGWSVDRGVITRQPDTVVPDEYYYTPYGTTVAYDPYANPNFICGFSTLNYSPAVIKNGRSWNSSVSDYNQSHFRCEGYRKRDSNGNEEATDYNKNTLNCPNVDYFSSTGTYTRSGKVTCVVELKKNDRIYLELVTRYYYGLKRSISSGGATLATKGDGTYAVRFNYDIKITPYTNKSSRYLTTQNLYYLPTEQVKNEGWGQKLKLGNFLNSNEKASDFINGFIKSFNIDFTQDGKGVTLNKAKKVVVPLNWVDLDDRINTDDITFQRIDYPYSMQVKWTIDESEAGAYRSIDTVEHQGAVNWKDYIDRGSDKILMDTTNEGTESSVESRFSYCWYEDFTYRDFDRNSFVENGRIVNMRLPLIAKDENFIVQSDEAMKYDGLSLKQRLWFRQEATNETFRMWNGDEAVVSIPSDTWSDYVMNYKRQPGSLTDRYFNLMPWLDSNYAIVECYLSPTEYVALKNGAMAKVDNDLYIVGEIGGYDPTGGNRTELKLIKMT